MRYVVDHSWQRFGSTVMAGSPLRLFRLTAGGTDAVADIEENRDVGASRLVRRLLDAGAIHPAAGGTATFTPDDVTVVTPQLGGRCHVDGRLTVDDGSEPPLDGAAVRLPVNRGPAAARNAARPLVTSPLVAFVDADVELPPADDWLVPLLPHFDDARVGLVAPRVTGEPGSPLDLGSEPARIRAGTRVSYVPAAVIVVRAEAFDAVGGFDEALRLGEDVDLVWRLDEAGWSCRYEPAAQVWHRPRATWRARLAQHRTYGTSAAPLALRHPQALAPMRSNGWTAAALALGLLGRPLAAVTVGATSAVALIGKLPGVPASTEFALAARGHLAATRQLATAVRRAWWPLVAVGALVSRRARWLALAAVVADVRSAPTDLAYATGVWAGMRRHRTLAPILPRISAWPARSRPSTPPARSRPPTPPARSRPSTPPARSRPPTPPAKS